jgi:hypothetical protein
MRTLIVMTLAVLGLTQTITSGALFIKLSSTQEKKPESQASEKQAEAAQLSERVIRLYSEGKFDEALPIANRVLELSQEVFGPTDAAVASAASNLAELHIAKHYCPNVCRRGSVT